VFAFVPLSSEALSHAASELRPRVTLMSLSMYYMVEEEGGAYLQGVFQISY
jgi:hypothetical protein